MKKIPGRAYSAEEKKTVLDQIYEAWCQAPDLRLGQLLLVSLGKRDLFYAEDTDIAKSAQRMGLLAADAIAHRNVERIEGTSAEPTSESCAATPHVVPAAILGGDAAHAAGPNGTQRP